jgi:hypothetical protein
VSFLLCLLFRSEVGELMHARMTKVLHGGASSASTAKASASASAAAKDAKDAGKAGGGAGAAGEAKAAKAEAKAELKGAEAKAAETKQPTTASGSDAAPPSYHQILLGWKTDMAGKRARWLQPADFTASASALQLRLAGLLLLPLA